MSCTFSIIVPIYNVEKYISECIESILQQTYRDFEVLCVDDCGNDNSISIVETYAAKDKRIKILRHKQNRGLGGARNTGLINASGKYVVCLDSDDWLEKNCLEILFREFQDKKTNSIWFDAYNYDDNTQKRLPGTILSNKAGPLTITPENICKLSDYTWIKAYTLSSIRDNNIFWPEKVTFEDGEFYFKYYMCNPNTYIIEDCLFNYRIREGSIVREAVKGLAKCEDFYKVVNNIRNFAIERGFYDKYKKSLLTLLAYRIFTIKNLCVPYQKTLPTMKKLLEDYKYTTEFEEFNILNKILFSIILPIENSNISRIKECLEAIQAQTFNNYEVLCVFNRNDKKLTQTINKFANDDYRIRILNKPNGDSLKNIGLENSNGDFVIILDTNKQLKPSCLSELYKISLESPNINTILFQSIEDNSLEYGTNYITLQDKYLACEKAYRKSLLQKYNLKWNSKNTCDDIEMCLKVFEISPDVILINKSLYSDRS